MKPSHSRPMPLPGSPPAEDPDKGTTLPVDPDDGAMPSPVQTEEEGSGWQPPV